VNLKIIFLAVALICNGVVAAFNAKWIRDGISPWWTTYIISAVSATVYAYQLRASILPITTASVFQFFFFHFSWYSVTIFVLHEPMTTLKAVGLSMAFIGMLLMSVK
jgi:multidrug transporter EmrE-like cation transporter